MNLRPMLLSNVSVLALMAVGGGAAFAADFGTDGTQAVRPGVSGLNMKVGGFGASLDDEAAGGGFVAVAFPLGGGFGAQIDGVAGSGGGGAFYGVGGHVFWRDPSRGLIGAYASHVSWDADSLSGPFDIQGADVNKVGLEGHLYRGRITLEGMAAYQFGSLDGFAAKTTFAYYVHDDFRVHVGASHLEGPGYAGFAGFEWAPTSGRGFSLFADIGVNEDHDVRTLAGLKLYLSPESKSLIRRHREDDPEVDLPSDLFQTGGCPKGTILINGFCDGNT